MNDKKQLARQLYFEGKTQKEIAALVGVSERTIRTWVHQYAWNKLRQASYQAPLTIVNNFSSQLVELQNEIASRQPGKRYPTPQEAEVSRKLQRCIEGTKKSPSLSQNMQMMELFRDFVRPLNDQFSKQLAHYSARFLEAEARKGFKPYEVEYGVDTMAISPYYDELNGEEPIDSTNPAEYPKPCTHPQYCLHEGNCKWPACKNVLLTKDDPKESRVEDTPWQPLPEPLSPTPEFFLPEPEITAESIDNTGIEPLPVASASQNKPEENRQISLRPPKPFSGEGGSTNILSSFDPENHRSDNEGRPAETPLTGGRSPELSLKLAQEALENEAAEKSRYFAGLIKEMNAYLLGKSSSNDRPY